MTVMVDWARVKKKKNPFLSCESYVGSVGRDGGGPVGVQGFRVLLNFWPGGRVGRATRGRVTEAVRV